MSSSPPPEGLCYVTSKVKDTADISDAKFNEFYNDEHLPDILRYNFSPLALRYRNADPAAAAAYLALYPLHDVASLSSPATVEMMEACRHSRVLDGRDHHALIDYTIGAWTKIQTFEGPPSHGPGPEQRARTLVAVAVDPADDADLDAWYRSQHLDMLAMCRGYRRSTRYARAGEGPGPRFLALHEYACEPEALPEEQIRQVRETEWSRRVLGEAKGFEREVWRLIEVQGDTGRKL